MVAVHRVFRTALRSAPEVVASAGPEDAQRVENVAGYLSDILAFLHVHHDGEDQLVWPKLRERCPDDAAVIDAAAAQHSSIEVRLGKSEAALNAWRARPGVPTLGTLLTGALGELEAELVAHLDEEEERLLPLCAAHLSMAEWGQLPAHGMANFKGQRIWLVLGLIRENMTQQQRDQMLAHMPPPAVEMWTTRGEPAFNEFIADIRRAS